MIPFTGTWFYPNSGVEQIIFPDFQVDGSSESNEIYWPSVQLANLYTAWSPQPIAGAPYSATITPVNGIEERFDSVKDGGSAGVNYINFYGQEGGFTDVVEQIYGGIVYAPSAETQALMSKGAALADSLYEDLAKNVSEAYSKNSDFQPSGKSIFGRPESDASESVLDSLNQMAVIIASNADMLIRKSTGLWDQYQAAKAKGDSAMTNFMNQLSGALTQGDIDWASTFNSGFGEVTMEGFQYNLPWNNSLYSQYRSIISNPDIVAWHVAVASQRGRNQRLYQSVNYLADLRVKNNTITKDKPEGAFTATPVSMFDKVQNGPDGAPAYAPRWSTSPVTGGTNSIEFDIETETVDSQTADFSFETQWSAEADASVKGWFFTAQSEASSGGTKKNAWSRMDSNAEMMRGSFLWSDLQSKQLSPSSYWWFPSAVSQAWSQVHTVNDPNYSGGFGFLNPKIANKFIGSEIYRLSSIAYGTPSAVVSGMTQDSSKYTVSNFENSYADASASGGVGWGPFSFGTSSSYSTFDQKSSNALKFSATGSEFTVTNTPLDGFVPQSGVGSPSSLVGVTLSPIGNTQAQPIASDSTSSRGKGKGGKSLFTYTAADDAKRRHYHDLGGGHDTHYGGSRRSIIDGGKGRDTLAGLNGSDVLSGENGKDVIYPGRGKKNIVYLGRGDDFIVFEKDDLGFTVVKDFSEGDRLSFSGFVDSDLKIDGKVLIAGDVEIAKFQGKGVESLLENAIEDAHYSLAYGVSPIEQIP